MANQEHLDILKQGVECVVLYPQRRIAVTAKPPNTIVCKYCLEESEA